MVKNNMGKNSSVSLVDDQEMWHERISTNTCVGARTVNNRLLLTAGRPPWYDVSGNLKKAFIIGICGGSASGKTTLSRTIIKTLKVPWVVILSLDSFYRDLDQKSLDLCAQGLYNFDSPEALDFDLALEILTDLKEGRKVQVPIYDFHRHKRMRRKSTVYGANVVIFEGILAFHDPRLLELMDLKIFVDTDCDLRLVRRLTRDVVERGRKVEDIIPQYLKYVKPCFDTLIGPSRKKSDIVISWDKVNLPAVNMIVDYIRKELMNRGFVFRSALLKIEIDCEKLSNSVHILPETNQVLCMQTTIRDAKCEMDDFIFYSQRLMRLVFSNAISLLPHEQYEYNSHSGDQSTGTALSSRICGVSIMRAGECFEDALVDVCENVKIGKILIQTSTSTDEPELFYLNLPSDIDECFIFLMDATIATGAAALMAIRILLDHGVEEKNIIITTLILTKRGAHTIVSAFPKVRIVAVACDPELNENFYILPGIGNFGNRYFGTF